MRSITTLLTLALAFLSSAQLPADSWLYGTWIRQGYAFEGSFYPVNSWNSEKLVLSEDYTLQIFAGEIDENQIKNTLYEGKWSYSAEYKKLRFYNDDERFSAQGKIITFDNERDVDFSSKNYFTVREQRGNHTVISRFQREGTIESFEKSVEEETARLANLALKYDPDSRVFYLVNSINPAKRKPLYFDEAEFNFWHTLYDENEEIERRESNVTGTIANFNDSSIIVNVENETIETDYVSGMETTVTNDYSYSNDGFVQREFKLKDLENVYSSEVKFTEILAPVTFTVSAITALIVAPLISINYKTGDFNKDRYYKTAGIGLIGIGASIPLAVIFNRPKPMRFIPLGEDAGKTNWYLQKSPR